MRSSVPFLWDGWPVTESGLPLPDALMTITLSFEVLRRSDKPLFALLD